MLAPLILGQPIGAAALGRFDGDEHTDLAALSLPAADAPSEKDPGLTDPMKPLADTLTGPHAVIDHLLAEVEDDLREGRKEAAATALGLAATRISLDAVRGTTPPKHVEWLAAHLRNAHQALTDGVPGKALQSVRRARLALRP